MMASYTIYTESYDYVMAFNSGGAAGAAASDAGDGAFLQVPGGPNGWVNAQWERAGISPGGYRGSQCFMGFDLDVIGPGEAVDTAVFSAHMQFHTNGASPVPNMVLRRYDFGASVGTSDWHSLSASTSLPLLGSQSNNNLTTGGYRSWPTTPALRDAIDDELGDGRFLKFKIICDAQGRVYSSNQSSRISARTTDADPAKLDIETIPGGTPVSINVPIVGASADTRPPQVSAQASVSEESPPTEVQAQALSPQVIAERSVELEVPSATATASSEPGEVFVASSTEVGVPSASSVASTLSPGVSTPQSVTIGVPTVGSTAEGLPATVSIVGGVIIRPPVAAAQVRMTEVEVTVGESAEVTADVATFMASCLPPNIKTQRFPEGSDLRVILGAGGNLASTKLSGVLDTDRGT